tara:strand:+ start:321 stop:524 length:204 start_codon:yes stop_codon:yes gene_type:complete
MAKVMGAKINITLLISISLLATGCALALPLAGAGSAVRSEVRVQRIEDRLESNERIIDYLLEQHPDM